MKPSVKNLVLNEFCFKQFTKNTNKKTSIIPMEKNLFMEKLNKLYKNNSDLKEGYAPFCKHLFIKNFTDADVYYQKITDENKKYLESKYEARTDYELAVLKRYFQKINLKPKRAEYLDIILYSKKQIDFEESKINKEREKNDIDYDWGVISVKPQDLDCEIPMDPITMMRNALGAEEGGSGVKLDREKYKKSVDFWDNHAVLV